MIVNRQHLDLKGQALFDRIQFKLPFKMQGNMQQEACFFMSCNAEGKLYTPNENAQVVAEEAILMKCGNYVRHLNQVREEKEVSEMILIHFYPKLFEEIYKNELPEFLNKPKQISAKYIEKIPLTDLLESYIRGIYFYFNHPALVTEELLVLKLKELIVLLVNVDTSGNVLTFFQSMFLTQEYDFKKAIEAHLYQELSVEDLAFLCNLSVSSFQRKFKEIYQDSPAHYFKSKRLEKASELLKIGKLSVTDICYEVGFSTPNYFTKAFKAYFGKTPSEYRQELLN